MLTFCQRRVHEMVGSSLHSETGFVQAKFQMDEEYWTLPAQNIPVASSQCRATCDGAIGFMVQPMCDRLQPWQAHRIAQGNARRHGGYVSGRVQAVAF